MQATSWCSAVRCKQPEAARYLDVQLMCEQRHFGQGWLAQRRLLLAVVLVPLFAEELQHTWRNFTRIFFILLFAAVIAFLILFAMSPIVPQFPLCLISRSCCLQGGPHFATHSKEGHLHL